MSVARLIGTTPGYAAVALACLLLNNGLLVGLDWAGLHYVYASLIAAAILIPVSYALHCRFTYAKEQRVTTFLAFAAMQAVNVPATMILLFLLHDLADIPMAGAAPLMTIIMALYNYVGSFLVIAANRPMLLPRGKK